MIELMEIEEPENLETLESKLAICKKQIMIWKMRELNYQSQILKRTKIEEAKLKGSNYYSQIWN